MFLYIPQSFATSDFVVMQVKANIEIFSKKSIDSGNTWDYNGAIVNKKVASVGLHLGGRKDGKHDSIRSIRGIL